MIEQWLSENVSASGCDVRLAQDITIELLRPFLVLLLDEAIPIEVAADYVEEHWHLDEMVDDLRNWHTRERYRRTTGRLHIESLKEDNRKFWIRVCRALINKFEADEEQSWFDAVKEFERFVKDWVMEEVDRRYPSGNILALQNFNRPATRKKA